ncbi:hypothetical protein H7849_16255 [Alloacidobacterium dinghuense]|uniref:Uncharacterized protein n=1 Tax=Alloacidobacterium dinghuense TaxID=2763107 RepID=A0A7G8BDQ7_9BACT|nr:hypothetical protein [Alloacidobacterium dinghuense]QNI30677.1 hypothetical protein H7849_16255 [Alloacidobacterium dinghuense]
MKSFGSVLVVVLTCFLAHAIANGQTPSVRTCSAFAADGTLATGTIEKGLLETRLAARGAPAKVIRTTIANPWRCEQGFSGNGEWLITLLPAEKLTIQILNVKKQELHGQFSSEWHTFHNIALEAGYQSRFLGGFAPDDSIILWRYVPQEGRSPNDASIVHLHCQRWSIEGELISDQDLGVLGVAVGGREPIFGAGFKQFWVPDDCGYECYRRYRLDGDHAVTDGTLTFPKNDAAVPTYLVASNRFFTVSGEGTKQKAVLLDDSGKSDSEADLPFFPNLLKPVVPDWFYVHQIVHSADDRFIAIGRSRVAWVLVDTDRDWGSEVLVLDAHSLTVVSALKVGRGGIHSLAIDHRERSIRLAGYWGGRWHDLTRDEQERSDWRESHGS